ncbi:MAG: hypothetical protein KIS77_05890 [Saprospiraceae bacterium]|nr:hypothetical protein [Saprospiraceae bacterium]
MKCGMHVFVIFFCTISISYSQNIFDNTELSLGYALKSQDRRLFEFPMQTAILYNEDSRIDFEYSILLNKILFYNKKINLLSGLGYSLSQTNFSRPFDHTYFTGYMSKELRYIKRYQQHNMIFNINPNIEIVKHKDKSFYMNVNSLIKFAINKDVVSGSREIWHHNKWKFETSAIEFNIGLGYQYKKIGINLAYRIFNIQKIDPVIFNQILFNSRNPPFLEKNYEIRNDNKFWLIVTYQIR